MRLNFFVQRGRRSTIQDTRPVWLTKPAAKPVPFASPAPRPGEDFLSISPEALPTPDWSKILGSGDGFTNVSMDWCRRAVILQQFDGPRAHERYQEHLAVLCHLRDSCVPITWVAGVSAENAPEPFILYNAASILNELRPLIVKSLLHYLSISPEKRAFDADSVWARADNIDNFYRHLAQEEVGEIVTSLSS